MENIVYEVEDHEENVKKMDKRSFKEYINDFMEDGDAKSICKIYRFNKKKIRMTLFTVEHDFTADEYIDHYRSLSNGSSIYGKDFMNDFDVYIIKKFNN
jgi:hypothetical protein